MGLRSEQRTLSTTSTHNFIRHYEQNRAPLGLYLHAAWFAKLPEMMDAFLAWMQSPTPSSRVVEFPAWREKCSALDTEDSCQESHDCELTSSHLSYKQRLQTCNPCPDHYPWLGDTTGLGRKESPPPPPPPSLPQREVPAPREREQPGGS